MYTALLGNAEPARRATSLVAGALAMASLTFASGTGAQQANAAQAQLIPGDIAPQPAPFPPDLTTAIDQLLSAIIAGHPAQLQVNTGGLSRVTLTPAFVERNQIRPAALFGGGTISFYGQPGYRGYNRPASYAVNGIERNGRVFWFGVSPITGAGDGSIGIWALPQDRIRVTFAGSDTMAQDYIFGLYGDVDNGVASGWTDRTVGATIVFNANLRLRLPLATAATGADLAAAYGGSLSGPSWDETLLFGIRRPVRLLTLDRPVHVGPFMIRQFAVRVRDNSDRGGRGGTISDADAPETIDPGEIVVQAPGRRARPPSRTIIFGRNQLDQCVSLTFNKPERDIRLRCDAVELPVAS